MTVTTPDLNTLSVREIMSDDTSSVTPDDSVAALARALLDRGVTGMPVVDDDGTLIGMVSEYDVINKRGSTVGEIMSRGVISITEDSTAQQVASLMGLHGIRRVPVIRDGQLAGIVSRSDLLRLFAATE